MNDADSKPAIDTAALDLAAADPYANYARLRREAPVSRDEGGFFQVARYADVMTVFRRHEIFSSDVSLRPPEERPAPSMLFSDPPMHNRLRKLVSHAFKPSHIESQRPLIEQRCAELTLDLCRQREADLVASLAAPLPVTVIAHMLGVEEGNMAEFKHWSDAIFSNIGDILFAQPSPAAQAASAAMDAYFRERIDELRRQPRNTLLGRLVEAETEDGRLTEAELLSFCRLLLIAGNETTTGLITASVRIFDEFPWTFDRLRESPEGIPAFIEEALRFYSPFSTTVRRTREDTELGGVVIPRGSLVLPLIASANRDEAVFARAAEFVPDRDPNPHLAFGFGIHNCLGAHLARLEGQIAVAALTAGLRGIRLAPGEVPPRGQLGGPSRLRVLLEAA